MEYLNTSLLQIYQWVCQRKNFENRLTFGEVMGKSLVSCYFESRCSGYRTRLWCESTQVWISPWTVMFIEMATAICSLWHGLCFTAVPRSTQPCIPLGSLNWVSATAEVRGQVTLWSHMACEFPYQRGQVACQKWTTILCLLTYILLRFTLWNNCDHILESWNMITSKNKRNNKKVSLKLEQKVTKAAKIPSGK